MGIVTVTLTTDFGLRDAYVGAVKGVILGISPEARLVDISHEVPPHDVEAGAFLLAGATPYFGAGTVHLAVVDPGVGSARRGLIVETSGHHLVGPDNGIFSPVFAAEEIKKIVEIQNRDLALPNVSNTFQGRDLFAPAAAHLCNGVHVDAFGPEITDPKTLDLWETKQSEARLTGEVVSVDTFGNGITNLSRREIEVWAKGRPFRVEIERWTFDSISRTYADEAVGEALVLYGSRDTLEVSICSGSAEAVMELSCGTEVNLVKA